MLDFLCVEERGCVSLRQIITSLLIGQCVTCCIC